MIEKDFDVPFVAALALREKQIQQNYRPIIGVHKWFARRPGTLFRSLLLSEFAPGRLEDNFFVKNDLRGTRVADPFMGGGTPLLEANRVGCNVVGYDINPMAYWIVRQEIEHLDLKAYREAADKLTRWLKEKIGHLYKTTCLVCNSEADVKYFLWVKTQPCQQCSENIDLFSGYLLAEDRRHPKNVFVCANCGELIEVVDRKNPGGCRSCGSLLQLSGPAKQNQCKCKRCGTLNRYSPRPDGPLQHRMFAIEYHCFRCRPRHHGRFFKKPDAADLTMYAEAESTYATLNSPFIPDDEIPAGDETDRLHRWGYRRYSEMFNARQLLGLALSCKAIASLSDVSLRNALATNLSDLLRYQNMLCRYDKMALKSLDIFSVHGFPVGLIQCESNFMGLRNSVKGTAIGSGGWLNIVDKYVKAKTYCTKPFEIQHKNGDKRQVMVPGEWIGNGNGDAGGEGRGVSLNCSSATLADLPSNSLDAVLTDPPYFSNVQYAELMDFCYVWLRRLVKDETEGFINVSTRNVNELTGNITMERGLKHFTEGLSEVFSRMARALKPGAPFAFTYHHNFIDAYFPVAVAVLDAGLTCTGSLPCPAEMGASIHISGTGSSIVDTIFVCRSTGAVPRRLLVGSPKDIADLVQDDITQLMAGEVTPSQGDIRCLIFGHLIRLAIWKLRQSWDKQIAVGDKLAAVANQISKMGGAEAVNSFIVDTQQKDKAPQYKAMVKSARDTAQFSS
jgi:adenine-specific DNA methylase